MSEILEEHYGYLADQVKIEQYQQAIERAVQPHHVVVDLGCGSGILGLMALRAGARKVYFVEDGAVIEIARKTVSDSGYADRAEFFQENSFRLNLPDKADIVICDHVGYFGFDYGILDFLADARKRFLQPDGVIIPAEIELQLAPVESEDCHKLVSQWRDGSVPNEFAWVSETSANTKHRVQLEDSALLSPPAALTTLKLGDDQPDFFLWNATFEVGRAGRLDGIAGWFDCRLYGNTRMTNAPQSSGALKRPKAFLALEPAIAVNRGECVKATVMSRHRDHILSWVIELPESGQRFSNSTFNSLLLDRQSLTQAQPERVATLSELGEARRIVLSYCDGKRTLADVQAAVRRDHPSLFPSGKAIDQFVMGVLAADTVK